MTVNTSAETTNISDRAADENQLAAGESIDGEGVEQAVGDVDSVTLFLSATADVSVTVELSPDGGETWYEMSESPVSLMLADNEDEAAATVHINYNASRVRLTGDTTASVTAQAREVV